MLPRILRTLGWLLLFPVGFIPITYTAYKTCTPQISFPRAVWCTLVSWFQTVRNVWAVDEN